jgi:Fur family ferric uptake transcriptional regulator/Fur family peroxide stress response transcriptional regulator
MQYLLENMTHPTIDQIYNDLVRDVPTLSKTTVYNTLKLFYDRKAVIALFIDEKNMRYDGDTTDHAHFRCKRCGMIYDVPLEKKDIPPFRGTSDLCPDGAQVYFSGICKKCM